MFKKYRSDELKKRKEDELSELAKSLNELQESMYNAATDLGIDPEDLKNELITMEVAREVYGMMDAK